MKASFLTKSKLNEAVLISLVFLIVELILVHFHEPWGDEVHSWAIANSSHSFSELFYNSRYEGHPKLWYLLLFILQKFTRDILAMQFLHVCIATSAVFVFCFYSPFSLLKNILFCCGYFMAYEYSILSRNYAIEVVLLFLCAGLYSKNRGEAKNLLLISILFFMLFQTNVYAIIIGFPFYCYIIWNIYRSNPVPKSRIYLSVVITLLGLVVSAISMKPPMDSGFSVWDTKLDPSHLATVLSTLFYGYFPLPLFKMKFWGTNFLDFTTAHIYIQAFLSILIIIGVGKFFRNNKPVLLLFCAGVIGAFLLMYTKYLGGLRHGGQSYLLFILCYWLDDTSKAHKPVEVTNNFALYFEKYFVPAILITQLIACCFANIIDIKYTFSNDKAVAEYLKTNKLDNMPLLGDGDYLVSGVAGILDKEIYYMRTKNRAKYVILDSNWGWFKPFSADDLLDQVDSIAGQSKSDVIVILQYPMNINQFKNWTLLKTFTTSIKGENYNVYRVGYLPVDPTRLNVKGENLLKKGATAKAMSLFIKAIQLKPDYGLAYMNLADCYNNGNKDYKKANRYIDSALKYAPDNAKVVFDKGAILFNGGDHSEALDFFKKASAINPKLVVAYLAVARCYFSLKDTNSAIPYLKESLKIDSTICTTYKMLALCYKSKGNSAEKDGYLKKAASCK